MTNCSSGSNLYMAPVAGALVVSLAVHAIVAPHGFVYPQLPPEEHTELSSKSTGVGVYAAGLTHGASRSTLLSSDFPIRF